MNVTEVSDRLADIRVWASDPEVAHAMEDNLVEDVLRHLAPTNAIAAEAVKVYDISYDRWHA